MHTFRRAAVVVLTVLATVLVTGLVAAPGQADAGIQHAQRRLDAVGCQAGPVDGRTGTWTRAALVGFQAANHLAQTGTLGAATRTRLYGDRPVHCDRRPVVRSGSGRRVVLSQRQNYLWLVAASGRVVAQGPVVDNPRMLRAGSYRAGSKCGRPAKIRDNSDASGRLRLHDFTRFAPCGIGFHQIPQYRSTGAQGIHPRTYAVDQFRAPDSPTRWRRRTSADASKSSRSAPERERPWIARDRLLLESETFFELAKRVHQAPVLDERLAVIRVDVERPAQAPLSGQANPTRSGKGPRRVPTCASAHSLSIASARNAEVFASE